jgi:hypothetical protein
MLSQLQAVLDSVQELGTTNVDKLSTNINKNHNLNHQQKIEPEPEPEPEPESAMSVLARIQKKHKLEQQQRTSTKPTVQNNNYTSIYSPPINDRVRSFPSVSPTSRDRDRVTLVCADEQLLYVTHHDLRDCLVHDSHTNRYVCAAVTIDTMKLVFKCIHDPNIILTLVESQLGFVLQASNILQVPFLFVLCCSRLFTVRSGGVSDLSFLHQLVAESFLSRLSIIKLLQFQQTFTDTNKIEQKVTNKQIQVLLTIVIFLFVHLYYFVCIECCFCL